MRMFLVGMCDTFLILYLITLNQVNPFHNSFLTVDDYNKLQAAKIQAEHDSEIPNAQILELKNSVSALDKEKEQALQLILTAKAETEKALQSVNIEKEKAVQTEIALSKTISKNEELDKLIQKSQENEQNALKIAKETQAESEKARENEQNTLKTVEELRLKAEEAKKNEEEMRRIAEDARLKAEEAVRNEEVARRIAEEERLKAEKARENETVALKMAENAENLKEIALKNEAKARKAEANALKVASVAQSETAKVESKIKSITQTSDKAYNENILDKLTQFTITIDYKDHLKHDGGKVITMQALPVKMGDDHLIFVPLDRLD